MRRCPYCGAGYPEDVERCPIDGNLLPGAPVPPPPPAIKWSYVPYSRDLRLALIFQGVAWAVCYFSGSPLGNAEIAGGRLLNWRTWIIACVTFWLGFLCVSLIGAPRSGGWRPLYVRYAFPALFVIAAYVVPLVFGVE